MWQPIETAPEEAGRILVFAVLEGHDAPDIYLSDVGVYMAHDGATRDRFFIDETYDGDDVRYGKATHWMPLPEPPAV